MRIGDDPRLNPIDAHEAQASDQSFHWHDRTEGLNVAHAILQGE